MNDLWNDTDAGATELDHLVYLSNLIGSDLSLVQPGGGNTSVKLEETDAAGRPAWGRSPSRAAAPTCGRSRPNGFTHLYLDRLATLRDREAMSDEEMMTLMRACMLFARTAIPCPASRRRCTRSSRSASSPTPTTWPRSRSRTRRAPASTSSGCTAMTSPSWSTCARAFRWRSAWRRSTATARRKARSAWSWRSTASASGARRRRECYANLCRSHQQGGGVRRRAHGRASAPLERPLHRHAISRRGAAWPQTSCRSSAVSCVRSGYACVLHFDDAPEMLEAIAA